VVRHLGKWKAAGGDGALNEHLRQATSLLPLWTTLLSECGALLRAWLDCELLAIPKGKGDPLALVLILEGDRPAQLPVQSPIVPGSW